MYSPRPYLDLIGAHRYKRRPRESHLGKKEEVCAQNLLFKGRISPTPHLAHPVDAASISQTLSSGRLPSRPVTRLPPPPIQDHLDARVYIGHLHSDRYSPSAIPRWISSPTISTGTSTHGVNVSARHIPIKCRAYKYQSAPGRQTQRSPTFHPSWPHPTQSPYLSHPHLWIFPHLAAPKEKTLSAKQSSTRPLLDPRLASQKGPPHQHLFRRFLISLLAPSIVGAPISLLSPRPPTTKRVSVDILSIPTSHMASSASTFPLHPVRPSHLLSRRA